MGVLEGGRQLFDDMKRLGEGQAALFTYDFFNVGVKGLAFH